MRKIVSLLLALFMILGTIPICANAENVIYISNEAELKAIANNMSGYYVLTNNIVLTENWIPIGNDNTPFTGTIDGSNYTISNLNISGTEYASFLGVTNGASIKNVSLTDVKSKIIGNQEKYLTYASSLIGKNLDGDIYIDNCNIIGSISTFTTSKSRETRPYTASIIAYSSGNIIIKNTRIDCNVALDMCGTSATSSSYTGGCVGMARSKVSLENVNFDGEVKAETFYLSNNVFIGGLVASCSEVETNTCSFNGNIVGGQSTSEHDNAVQDSWASMTSGGIVGNVSKFSIISTKVSTDILNHCDYGNGIAGGMIGKGDDGSITSSQFVGDISNYSLRIGIKGKAGGLIGQSSTCSIINSSAKCDIYNRGYHNGYVYTGGLLGNGNNVSIFNSSASGQLTSTAYDGASYRAYTGGITGCVEQNFEYKDCLYNKNYPFNGQDSGVGTFVEDSTPDIPDLVIHVNSPTLSMDSTNITLTLGEQEWITGWINGIYTKIPETELTLISSNENILPIISQDSMCMSPLTEGDECFSSISAFVKGAAPGTSTLTFYCQGEKLGTIDVTVESVIADTISDETILKAEILNRNSQFDSHRNTIQSPAVVLNNALMNNSSQSWATAYMFTYELSKILSLSVPDLEKFDMKSYYEAVLMDILENDNESVWSEFYSTWGSIYGGYNEDIVQKIIDEIPEFEKYKDTKLSKETDIEIVLDTITDTKGEFKDIKIDFSLFDTFGFCYDTLTDNLAVIDEIYAYSAITQEKIDVLKSIQEKTSNAELAKACESMIKRYQEVHSEVVAEVAASAARESLIATGTNILELSQNVIVDLFLQVAQTTSAAELVKNYSTGKMIMTGSRLATDLVINSTDISKNIFVIAAYSDIENEIKQVISSSETAFERNKTYDNAVKYIASADVFKAALLNSCDLYIKFVKDVESGTKGLDIAKGLILGEPKDILKNLWQVNAEYNEKIKQAERIKSMIQTTDFYDTYGTDIVEYISHIVSTTPSAWAQEYIDWAIANNLLPYDYLRGNYQNNITRAEFCTLLTFMIQEFTGKNIEELQGNLPYDPKLFSDSYYDYVYYMASLGIVNGVSETEFNPLGEITREEAAVMLYRAAKVAGCDVSAPATNLNGVSNWATDGVNFVVDRGIMNGTDVGFEPKGTYTKEQAITTFVRFIENLK